MWDFSFLPWAQPSFGGGNKAVDGLQIANCLFWRYLGLCLAGDGRRKVLDLKEVGVLALGCDLLSRVATVKRNPLRRFVRVPGSRNVQRSAAAQHRKADMKW